MNENILLEAKNAVLSAFGSEDEIVPDTFIALTIQLGNWMEVAAQNERNVEFYKNLLIKCADHLGSDVFVSDDGSVEDKPIFLKIPELVESRMKLFFTVGRALETGNDVPQEA